LQNGWYQISTVSATTSANTGGNRKKISRKTEGAEGYPFPRCGRLWEWGCAPPHKKILNDYM